MDLRHLPQIKSLMLSLQKLRSRKTGDGSVEMEGQEV